MLPGVVQAIDFRERLQPGLAALLPHHAPGSPDGETVVKALVDRSYCLLARIRYSCVVKAGEITDAIVGGGWHDPGIAASGERMRKTVVVLKQEERMSTQGTIHRIPVDRVGKIDIEVRNDRLPFPGHICWR